MSIVFARTSTGGAVARVGFEYQDGYALLQFCTWLTQDAFSGMVSELLGDTEVTYFSAMGQKHLCMELKNHALSGPKFWDEMVQFKALHESAPETNVCFRLVSPSTPAALDPMRSMLTRLHGVVGTYPLGHQLREEAEEEIIQWVVTKAGQQRELAEFVVHHVEFEDFNGDHDGRFLDAFADAFPALADVPAKRVREIKANWESLIAMSVKGHITRREIEDQMLLALNEEEQSLWRATPSRPKFQLGLEGEKTPLSLDLAVDMRPFVRDGREARTTVEWDDLHHRLESAGEFLLNSRPRRRVQVNSHLRMTAAVVVGMGFKATKGHALSIEHRGNVFHMDDHLQRESIYFNSAQVDGSGSEGVVSIQIATPTREDVKRAQNKYALETAPTLHLETEEAIGDLHTLNRAVNEAKRAIAAFKAKGAVTKIHLIIKGPSFFAVALGHRLNALGPIQLYDWMGDTYAATALIRT